MSNIGDALGTAVEGGLLSRAVASKATGKQPPDGDDVPLAEGHFSESSCLNCGELLTGPHCHQCGQKAHLHRTLGAFMHDLLHGALHFEGKTWKTLPKLAFKPGELTRRYIAGERARFVSPMALFLFSIFLMFAVFQAVGLTTPTDIDTEGPIAQAKVQASEARADVQLKYDALPENDPQRADLSGEIAKLDTALAAIETGQDYTFTNKDDKTVSMSIKQTGWNWLDNAVQKWRTNPSLMLYKLQANSYKFSWLLIPLSIPFVWLLFFWKRRFKAYDHAIFVTYSIAFMSLLFITISLLIKFGAAEWLWGSMLAFIPPVHMYKQLRGAYGLSRFSALWRLAVLLFFIAIVAMLFLQVLLLLGAI
ncbi:DUF3667 domain-containing protein [Qipengyuania marisflavi]|uniref:DUF3667 domain-containing protein n=1 Tax=Qipengyuania marisflavi TaxID=2486356 RepID=A0A5S3P2L8_9SPHN|nr:DUF3667 domain-containing protein [Qipengyuania marisflavi]TMM47174.1 DUF3667 domain-containing protein [Qipengyuania marisflavi]